MLIIGFLLILLAAAVITYVLLATAGMAPVEVSYGVLNVEVAPLWLFLSGVLTLAVAAIGLWMVAAGTRSKARKAREVRELRKQAKEADRRAVRATDGTQLDGSSTGRPATGAPGRPTAPPPGPGSSRPGTPASPERNRLEPDR
jgi:membrane protein implicated in regulation of membrane protease activity